MTLTMLSLKYLQVRVVFIFRMLKCKNYLQSNNLQTKSSCASGKEGEMKENIILVENEYYALLIMLENVSRSSFLSLTVSRNTEFFCLNSYMEMQPTGSFGAHNQFCSSLFSVQ